MRYSANRKEIKDHGDKGILLGSPLRDGDRVVIVEDVTTAGTSIRETVPILRSQADVSILGLIVSVDRMEKGTGKKSALSEIEESFGFATGAIVTMEEVTGYLSSHKVEGKEILTEQLLERIREYYAEYGAEE